MDIGFWQMKVFSGQLANCQLLFAYCQLKLQDRNFIKYKPKFILK